MDRDRERFAQLAERAKRPPFRPLDNLLNNGAADLITDGQRPPSDFVPCYCGCTKGLYAEVDHRVSRRLQELRLRKGATLAPEPEPEPEPDPPTLTDITVVNWGDVIEDWRTMFNQEVRAGMRILGYRADDFSQWIRSAGVYSEW